jgi:hypothetical protein
VLALRGGKAAPEAPFVIEHREALIYMLYEAAELEHGIMCQYLFAAFSLKQREDEGLTADAREAVLRWRRVVAHVAAEEMLHLALVQNLLSAIGSAPHLTRPNLPAPARHYPAGVNLTLVPFGEPALRHFMFLERPEGMELQGAEGIDAPVHEAVPLMAEGDIVPQPQDFATLGHLYRSIEHGLDHLAGKFGERNLFAGPARAQATSDYFHWPELVPVTDLASAHQAIDTILEQGEGARGHWESAHFGQFVRILDEYRQLKAANPDFEPARPVLFATVRPSEHDDTVPRITEDVTARCTDLFNVGYEVLLQMLHRYFAHTEETDAQLMTLSRTAIALMFSVLRPLGDMITTLPVGPKAPGDDGWRELRALLRERLPGAAPRGRLGAPRGTPARRSGLLRPDPEERRPSHSRRARQRTDWTHRRRRLTGQPLRRLGRGQPLRRPRARHGEHSGRGRRHRSEGANGRRSHIRAEHPPAVSRPRHPVDVVRVRSLLLRRRARECRGDL